MAIHWLCDKWEGKNYMRKPDNFMLPLRNSNNHLKIGDMVIATLKLFVPITLPSDVVPKLKLF